MSRRGRSRDRSDFSMDNGRGHARRQVKDAYNKAQEAVDEYNYSHPGTNLQLETLNLADNDPHNENDIQIPIEFTHCNNITKMGEELCQLSGTQCYLGYRTSIDADDVLPQHILHIDPRGLYPDDNTNSASRLLSKFTQLPLAVRILTFMLFLAMVFKFMR